MSLNQSITKDVRLNWLLVQFGLVAQINFVGLNLRATVPAASV